KDIHSDPLSDKAVVKDIHTDTLFVPDQKHVVKDVHKDPISDPIGTLFRDPSGTLQEGVVDPGQFQVNPATGQVASGLLPFVMATPHHAPAAAVNLQAGALQQRAAGGFKQLPFETLKELSTDNTLKEVIQDHTLKEVVHDTLKELIHDTQKEVIETQVEGGGTLVEGGQIPGGIPGIPGFF
ncbi:MAG: hypothetical protein ABW061_28600, partial [Polyangiaceae bacterium]